MIELTEQQLKELLKEAWWEGHRTSKYCPNLAGSANTDSNDIIKYFKEKKNNG